MCVAVHKERVRDSLRLYPCDLFETTTSLEGEEWEDFTIAFYII